LWWFIKIINQTLRSSDCVKAWFIPILENLNFNVIFLNYFFPCNVTFLSYFLKEGNFFFFKGKETWTFLQFFFWTFLNNRIGKLWQWNINLMSIVSLFQLVKLNCNCWHNRARWTQLDGTPYVQHRGPPMKYVTPFWCMKSGGWYWYQYYITTTS